MLWTLLAVLLVLAVPVVVFGANGLALLFDSDFYSRGQIQQRVDDTYGLSQQTLVPVNRAIVRFFQSGQETLPQSLEAEGADPSFFGERELVHMEDVRGLARLIALLQRGSLLYGIIFVVLSFVLFGTKAVGRIGTCLILGGVLTMALVLLAGALTVIDFGELFRRFHLLSFSNDFWLLDPRTDHLVQMFPFAFWFSATLTIALRSLLSAGGLVVAGVCFVWLGRRLL